MARAVGRAAPSRRPCASRFQPRSRRTERHRDAAARAFVVGSTAVSTGWETKWRTYFHDHFDAHAAAGLSGDQSGAELRGSSSHREAACTTYVGVARHDILLGFVSLCAPAARIYFI